METEILILKTDLSNLFRPDTIKLLCNLGYRETGNKFSVQYHGSKGYLSHIEISCEGFQKEDNKIFDLFNTNGSIKKKTLNVFYSERNGVRLSFGKDQPRIVSEPEELPKRTKMKIHDGLPF